MPRRPPPPDAGLDEALARARSRAKGIWPDIAVDPSEFDAHLLARVPPDLPPSEGLASLHTDDLYLACACTLGDPNAIRAFEARFLSQVGTYLARVDRTTGLADEVRQRLAEDFLVGAPGRAPGIARYSGRGPLGGFVRLAAIRSARYLLRGAADRREERTAAAAPRATGDPELDLLKRRYAPEFQAAFAAAVAALDTRARAALKLHFLDGMTMESIAVMYRVNKSTVARWIARARQDLFGAARRLLAERLDVDRSEVDSLIGLLESRLDLTARWFL